MRLRAEASVDQHILHGLAGDIVAQPAHRLNDLGVSPAGLLSNANDRFADALLSFGALKGATHWRFKCPQCLVV